MTLTKYEKGSVRELWTISLPLMLSSLSVMMMWFVDRLLLAHYSTDAFNAAVSVGAFGWAFIIAWISLVGIAEVFVAQYNGAGDKSKLGEPVWQMIWLSLLSLFFFIPLAFFGSDYLFGAGKSLEKTYFFWTMLFAPAFVIESALATFFIGQGKLKLITAVVVIANILNAALDVALIFGIDGYIPEMGIIGAAIATSIGGVFQCMVLGYVFLNKENRTEFGTGKYKIQLATFLSCLRIGLPGSILVAMEMLGWASYYNMMAMVGESYITVAGICQSIVMLFFFVADGVSKASMTISGNLIGAREGHLVSKVFWSGCKLHLIMFAGMIVCFFFGSNFVMDQFLSGASPSLAKMIREPLFNALFLILFYLFFEGIRMLLWGLLTAATDTWFLLVAGTVSVWAFLVLPIYYFMVLHNAPIEMGMFICLAFSILACLGFYWRLQSSKWDQIEAVA